MDIKQYIKFGSSNDEIDDLAEKVLSGKKLQPLPYSIIINQD